jgi:hypothetical protein
MITTNIALLLLGMSLPCFCQEKMKIDLNAPAARTEPEIVSGKGMSGDHTRRNSIWTVNLSVPAVSTESTKLEVRIVNVSSAVRSVPVSQDGVGLVAACPEHTVLQRALFLESREDAKYFRQLGLFYGCESVPATLVRLEPGEWVTYVTNISTGRLPKQIRAHIRMTRTKYLPGPTGQTAEDQEYDTSDFSPWVTVPSYSGVPNE